MALPNVSSMLALHEKIPRGKPIPLKRVRTDSRQASNGGSPSVIAGCEVLWTFGQRPGIRQC